jgi:cytochrome c oxidase cbb3-type subunit 3
MAALLLTALLAACEREDRPLRSTPVLSTGREEIALSTNSPGPGAPTENKSGTRGEYEKNAFHVSQGTKLSTWYNCSGCHANGGGGSGPALMDDVWIYGSEPMAIYQTIAFGRPNGMPAFGKRVPEDQLWQLVAYVRSLSGLASQDAAPNRNDALEGKPPESLMDKPQAVTSTPGAAH